jgi:hypothetical protein
VDQATQPLRERYLADLKKLMEQATKAGKLDDALAIKNMMRGVSAGGVDFNNRIADTRWKWGGGFELCIKADGTATGNDGSFIWMAIKPFVIEYSFKNGNHGTIEFEKNLEKAAVLEITPQGAKSALGLVRVKG